MRRPLPVTILPEEIAKIDPRWREVAKEIEALQRRDLTYWESFQIELPETAFEEAPTAALSEVFQAPTDDELEAVARGADGALQRLSAEQLRSLKEEGQFAVPSQRYAGQRHVWVLSAILQRGRAFIRERRRRANAAALRQLRFQVANRLLDDDPISVRDASERFIRGIYHSVDLLLGLPQKRPRYSESKLEEIIQRERRSFVLEGFSGDRCVFSRADGLTIDLALREEELMEKAWPIIEELCAVTQEEFKAQVTTRTEALFASLRERGIAPSELASHVTAALTSEQRELLARKIQESAQLAALYPNLPTLLINQMKAVALIEDGERQLATTLDQRRGEELARLQREHPTLSLIPEWRYKHIEERLQTYTLEKTKESHQKIEQDLREAGLSQEAHLFSRGITFCEELEPKRRARLIEARAPARTFTWPRYIWRPRLWEIKRNEPQYEEQAPAYYAEKYRRTEVKTDAPLWRLQSAFWRAASFLNNGLHWLLIKNAWSGPVGLRALFGRERFSPFMEVNPRSGELVPSKRRVPTFRAMLRTIAKDVRDSRRRFEEKPDTGIIGKSFSRWINRAWNYLIKGLLGSLLVFAGQPILTAMNLALVLLLVLTSVVWAPLASIGVLAVNVLFVDTEAPTRTVGLPLLRRALQVVVFGVGQCALALLLAGAFHPLCAGLFFGVGGLVALLRAAYDDLVRALILRPLGRVPATSSFLARRVSGPGLSSEFYFQVRPDLVLLLARAGLERIELEAFRQRTHQEISAPLDELQRFTAQLFGWFVRYPEPNERVAELVQKTTTLYTEKLEAAVKQRANRLDQIALLHDANRIRQTRQDLQHTLSRVKPMVQSFCQERLFSPLTTEERDAFFIERGLTRGDFGGLARWLLSSSISPGLLEPLEDADQSLRLLVEPLNLSRYVGALREDKPIGDDLDRVRGDAAELASPYLASELPLRAGELFGAQTGSLARLLSLPPVKHRPDLRRS